MCVCGARQAHSCTLEGNLALPVCAAVCRMCVQGLSAAVSACERWMEQRASVGACLWWGLARQQRVVGVCRCSWRLAPQLVLMTPTAIKGDLTTAKPCFWKR